MSANSHNPNPVKKARTACRNWPNCQYGEKCKFAHGDNSTRSVPQNQKSTTDLSADAMLAAMRVEMDKRMAAGAATMAPIKRQQELCAKVGISFGAFGTAAEPMKKNLIGEQLYPKITTALKEGEETMRETGLWHSAITAGKITGMILEAFKVEESLEIAADDKRLGELMVEACEAIKKHAEATQKA